MNVDMRKFDLDQLYMMIRVALLIIYGALGYMAIIIWQEVKRRFYGE